MSHVDITSDSVHKTPEWLSFLLFMLAVLCTLLPPGIIRASSGLIPVLFILYLMKYATAATLTAYAGETACLGLAYSWFDYLVLHTIERDCWQVNTTDNEMDGCYTDFIGSSWKRLCTSFSFWCNARKIGWNVQISGVPTSEYKDTDRHRFLVVMLYKACKMYIGLDCATTLLQVASQSRTSPVLFDEPMSRQLLTAWALAFNGYCSISLGYHVSAFLAVLVLPSSPSSWPPVNGSFRNDTYSIRAIWGRFWQQFTRRSSTTMTRAVCRVLGIRRGTTNSKNTGLWVAFVMSAFSHYTPTTNWADGGLTQAMFFVSQAPVIMIEDYAIRLCRMRGLQDTYWSSTIGRLWVLLWFSFSLRYHAAYMPLGLVDSETPTLCMSLLRRLGLQI